MNIETSGKSSRFKLLKTYNSISSNTLKEELDRRKIPLDLASTYLQQALVLDRRNQRKYMAFAYCNVVEAIEIIIPFPSTGNSCRSSIDTVGYTYIEGKEENHAQIFSCIWDFLTWLTINGDHVPRVTTFILNGRRTVADPIARILSNNIVTVVDFFGNSERGDRLRDECIASLQATQVRYAPQNYLYSSHKDLNDYWINDPNAENLWPMCY